MTGNSTFEYYNANRDGKNVGDCTVIGASSDHTILDVENVKDKIHVGDVLEFGIKAYGPMAYLTHSDGVRVVCKGGKANT